VTTTQGQFRDQNYRAHPEQEAERIHQYLTKELQLPGIVCVIRTTYHTESGGTAVPVGSPALDTYRLDPRDLGDLTSVLLVDKDGWVVESLYALQGWLIGRLLTQ